MVSKFMWGIVVLQQGYPQGSTLGSLLFLLCIHDVSDDLIAHVKLFADDNSVLFIRPYLDYGDVIYEQPYKESFNQKLESAAVAIAGAIRGTSRQKLCQELGLESLQKQPWYRKLFYFFKIFKGQSPDYLSKILPGIRRAYNTINVDYIPYFNTKHNLFGNSFSPSTLIGWNNLDINIRNSESYATFKHDRRKVFLRWGKGVGVGGLSKNVGHHVWPTTKSKKKTLAKTPQSTPPKNEIWTKT